MKFGFFHEFPYGAGITEEEAFQEAFAVVDAAEEIGVDEIWLAEYHFLPNRSVLSAQLTVGGAVAARTRRIRIGLGVHVLPLRHPVHVAEEVATLDQISNGRVEVGIGRSTFPSDYDAFGVPYVESRGRFRESLDIILKAWSSERFTHDGEYFHLENVWVIPKPVQKPHPPISVGVTSAETFKMVGQMGYPVIVNPTRSFTLSEVAPYVRLYRDAWREAGHKGQPQVGLRLIPS